jgi:hypothetical protein
VGPLREEGFGRGYRGLCVCLFSLPLYNDSIKCLPSNILVAICQMFCEDYVEACLGAPDVIVWNVEDTEYKLVHIKGPGYPSRQSKKVEVSAHSL